MQREKRVLRKTEEGRKQIPTDIIFLRFPENRKQLCFRLFLHQLEHPLVRQSFRLESFSTRANSGETHTVTPPSAVLRITSPFTFHFISAKIREQPKPALEWNPQPRLVHQFLAQKQSTAPILSCDKNFAKEHRISAVENIVPLLFDNYLDQRCILTVFVKTRISQGRGTPCWQKRTATTPTSRPDRGARLV